MDIDSSMLFSVVPTAAFASLSLVIILSIIFVLVLRTYKKKIKQLSVQLESTNLLVDELNLLSNKLQTDFIHLSKHSENILLESSQVSKQLEHRIKTIQQQNIDQQQLLVQLQEEQGQDKFYSRAFKLAEKGANIEEIMQECELPRAEVEMILSVYQQRSSAR